MGFDVEIISVGNELLIGRTVNTNATWLGKKLTVRGFSVRRITAVRDDMEDIVSAIREALVRRPRLIVITGGLGPTFDDMTSEALAKALGRRWVVNEEALREIREKYEGMGLELTDHRVKMAKMPEGARPLRNPVGTAPGIMVEEGDTIIVALPGVPSEMKAIFEGEVEPLLDRVSPPLEYAEEYMLVEGVPESALAPIIEGIMRRVERVYIKSHPRGKEALSRIVLHIQSYDSTGEKARGNVEACVRELEKELPRLNARFRIISPDEVEW